MVTGFGMEIGIGIGIGVWMGWRWDGNGDGMGTRLEMEIGTGMNMEWIRGGRGVGAELCGDTASHTMKIYTRILSRAFILAGCFWMGSIQAVR